MALELNDFDGGKSITRARGPGNLDVFGPEMATSEVNAQLSIDFQGPPLPVALQVDLPPSKLLRPVQYKQHVH